MKKKARVLVISDLHIPAERKGALQFCKDIYKAWCCNEVVFIGDITDNHAFSFHAKHPELFGPLDEYELALKHIARWYKVFPKAKVCIGNHDELFRRQGRVVSLCDRFIKDYKDLWNTPGWDWQFEHKIDNVLYLHGTGNSGQYHAANLMRKMLMSVVAGHIHHAGSINWAVNPERRIFGMNVGSLIDDKCMQFDYCKHAKQRSFLGVGVVIEGEPYLEPLPCSKGEPYYDGNF